MLAGSWLFYSCGHTERSGVGRCWQADDESCTCAADVVVTENLASMLFHDSVADTEAEAGAFADLLGGEERVKNLVGVDDAAAVIGEGNLHGVAGLGRHDFDARRTANLANSVIGVVQNVQENLLQLVGVADDIGQSLIEMLHHVDAV